MMSITKIGTLLYLALIAKTLCGQSNNQLENLNVSLKEKLELIYDTDQKYRQMSDWKMVMKTDSINQIEIIKILDQSGWLGEDVVGKKGAAALFLVIQHAELPVQEKYLPMMQEAVKKGKARIKDLALLEDRVLMRQGKKQIYGSQIKKDEKGNWVVHPIEDAANVDKRRSAIGFSPIAEYLLMMGVTWNLEEHLKQQQEDKK